MIRLLHTADIHLARQFPFLQGTGSEYRNQLLRTFERIVGLAISEDVALVLIAGDLFDTNRVYGITIEKVLSAFKKLEASGIRVCVLPGIHDAYDEDSIYRFVQFPPNVTVFTPERTQETYEPLNLTVYGFVSDERSRSRSSLRSLTLSESSEFHVGIAHGSIAHEKMENDAVILDESEIAISGLDYLALGHRHSLQDLSQGDTKAWYSGSPEPLDINQKSAGNVCIVTINEKGNVQVAPVRVGTKKCEAIEIDISPLNSVKSIVEKIEAKAELNLILEVALTGLSSMDYDLNPQKIERELGEQFFCLRVLDRSHPKLDKTKSQDFPGETATGRFLEIAESRIATATNAGDKQVYEEVLKLGMALLQGRSQVIE